MKQDILSFELTGDALNKYIQKLKNTVERELKSEVSSFDWDMDDKKVFLSVNFKDGSPATFAFDAWQFTGESAYFDYDVDIILDRITRYIHDNNINGHTPDTYEFIKSKSVLDSDGFQTDYTMYYDTLEDMYVFIFGDNDIYTPENSEVDWDCKTKEEADEWFESYVGPGEDEDDWEDDIEECQDIMSDWNIEDQIDAPDTIGKLNPGDKFVNRNGVVVEIIEPDRLGHVQFKIGDEVKSGDEKSIQQMLYRNNYMRMNESKITSSKITSYDAINEEFKLKDSDWYRLITRIERKTGMKVIDGEFDDERKFLTLQAPDGTIYHGEISQTVYYEFDSHWLTE